MDISEATALIQQQALALDLLQERLSTLEGAIVPAGWERLSGSSGADFERSKLQDIADWAKIYWLKSPLIRRAVEIQNLYVWASGYSVTAEAPEVNALIDKFWKDPKNLPILSHQGLETLERDLRLNANIFFSFFTNETTGRVIIRTMSFSEVVEIITDPQDRQEKWFYVRQYAVNDRKISKSRRELYPDWRYQPIEKPDQINGLPVNWDIPIFHVKTNSLSDMLWGISEVYCAIDWAKGYKEFLEDWLKLVKAYSRFAWNATVRGGASAVAAAATSLEAMLNPDPNGDQVTAGIFVGNQNTQMQPYKFSGATTAVDDARRYMLMVGSATGTPEHLLAADPSTSNLATSKTLERPSELQYLDRQKLWTEILESICQYVIDQSVRAPRGILRGIEVEDEYGETQVLLDGDLSRKVAVSFPDVVEHDLNEQITALIDASTLKGQSLAGTLDLKTITRLLLRILKVDAADDILKALFPTDDLIMQRVGTPVGAGSNNQDNTTPPNDNQVESTDREIANYLKSIKEAMAET